ncbi:MAG: RNA polymerase sigma factor [Rhodospirillaceae bacterium]|nr:RNA polymerase sigma factor [Rhodospirillaceae bacterium]
MVASGESDATLALRARDGNRKAFDQLIIRHKVPLYRLVRRYVGNPDDAYDVLQESLIAAWLALRRYDPAREFSIWLRAIALNKCRDFARRQAVRGRFLRLLAFQRVDEQVVSELSSKETIDDVRLQRLDEMIATLPVFYKEPLLLTMVTGLSQQEAAAQLRTTPKAIEMRLRRAKKKLAEALSDLTWEG